MRTVLKNQIARFYADRGGNFAIMTALLAVPLLMAGGFAVDYSMATSQRTNLQEVADGAALAGGKIFDGTNLSDAKAAAESFIKSYGSSLPTGYTYAITGDGRTLKVALGGTMKTSFMKMGNLNNVNLGVNAAAISPMKPQKITFTPTKAQGWYYKKVSVIVTRTSGSTATLATVTYQPTTHNDSGQGTYVVNPTGVIDLGVYTKLVLQMDIKYDGCPLKQTASVNNKNDVTCSNSSKDADKKYDFTLRTDNLQQTNYLFVDGVQLPVGVTQPLETYFGCNKPQSHAWEDGGGWDRQDFFYTVSSDCTASDGDYVRLTQ